MSQELGKYNNDNDISENIKELRRSNIKMKKIIGELREMVCDIKCDEGQHLKIIYVNKTRNN